jgi:predicted flap endonuclease-1-like 5' DNA nuclease
MRQGKWSKGTDLPRRVDMSLRKGNGVGALLMGLVGFGLGLLFGWLLHRERVARVEYEGAAQDSRATATLADTSARLELADQDMVNLRGQLTDAQHLLDERDATIAQLEADLVAYRDAVSEFDVDETEVTDEVLVPPEVEEREVVVEEVVVEEAEPVVEPEPEPVVEPELEPVVEPELEPVVEPEPEPVVEPKAPLAEEPVVEEPVVAAEPIEEPELAEELVPDDLRRMRGLGPAMERSLNEQGIVAFRQIANLDDAGIEKLEAQLPGIAGRIRRNNWIEQARDLHIGTYGEQP